jgi:uncharacterized protein YbaP (TraB family)
MKSVTIFFVILFSYSSLRAQEKSLLWEISGNGLEKPSYLYGTMHIADKRIFKFGDSVMIAFKLCNAYAGEIVIDKESKKATANYIFMPGDTTLSMFIGDSGLAKVKRKFRGKLFLFAGLVNRIKPFFTMALIAEGSFKNDKSASLDEYFQKLAKKQKKGVIGIESIAEQMSAVDKIPLSKQAQMLLDEVNNPAVESEKDVLEMLNTYLAQDISKLQDFMEAEETPDELNQYVLLDRNYIMADRIDLFIRIQSTFIGVGAAHLGGEKGLIELLRAKGYAMRAVKAPFKT